MKKLGRILSLLILLGAAGAAFYFGWTQFKISSDSCGVLVSKTSGVSKKPIEPGVFSWHWQLLLPTNGSVRVFSLTPYVETIHTSGQLPSAEMYKQLLMKEADFSYDFMITLAARYTPEEIVHQVELQNVQNDDEMKKLLQSVIKQAGDLATQFILTKDEKIDSSAVMEYLTGLSQFAGVEFTQCSLSIQTFPDLFVYEKAKDAFGAYQKKLEETLSAQAEKDATDLSQDSRDMAKLAKLGELLRQYPELSEVLKNSSISEALKSIRNIQ